MDMVSGSQSAQELGLGNDTEPMNVVIVTPTFFIEGTVHMPALGRDARRLTNLLNSDKDFIAVTDATLTSRKSGDHSQNNVHTKCEFLHVNREQIEMLWPRD